MREPNTQQVLGRRNLALMIIRAVALVMIVYGTVQIILGVGMAFGMAGFDFSQGIFGTLSVYHENTWNGFWQGFSSLVPGIALALASRRISRWVVPLPRHECPNCGYALTQLTTSRCPECGYVISREKDAAPGKPVG